MLTTVLVLAGALVIGLALVILYLLTHPAIVWAVWAAVKRGHMRWTVAATITLGVAALWLLFMRGCATQP